MRAPRTPKTPKAPATAKTRRTASKKFGLLVRQILARHDITATDAAKVLGVNASQLRNIINGHAPVTQRWLKRNNWPDRLERTFPDGWRRYQGQFAKVRFHDLQVAPRRL